MTDYAGSDFWKEFVRIIKQSDTFSGGINSPLNQPHQDLADRTVFIRERLAETDVVWFDPDETNPVSTGTKRTYYAPYDLDLQSVNVQAVTAPTSAVKVDVHLEGITIFTSSPKPSLDGVNFVNTVIDATSGGDVAEADQGDKIELIVDESGTGGAGLKIILVAKRRFA